MWLFKKCEFLSRGELCDLNSEKMLIWSDFEFPALFLGRTCSSKVREIQNSDFRSVVQNSDFARSTLNNVEVIYVKTVSRETVFGLLSKNKSRHHPPWLMTCDFCHIFCPDYCRSSKISKISALTSMLNFTPIHER